MDERVALFGEPQTVTRAASTRSGPGAEPVSNDIVTVTFRQHVGDTQPLRTGSYSETLTFTLPTTTP